MATLNYFFSHQLTPAMRVRAGNFVELFNVKDFLLSRGFEGISEGSIDETLFNIDANKIFDLQLRKTAKPRHDFIFYFNQKELRNQVKKMIYEGVHPTSALLNDYYFERSEINQRRFSKTLELLLAYL